MKHAVLLASLTLCSLLAACGSDSDSYSITHDSGVHLSNGSIRAKDGQITLRTSDTPDATITAQGDLTINQQTVAVDPAIRDLLKSYYQNATAVRTDGIATGKAGAEVGKQAVESVKQGLASGHPDQIGQQIEAKAQVVKEAALKICQDLGGIQSAQDQLAAQLPAFKPYGHIVSINDVSDCRDDIHVH
jgi:hypothetical protein